MQEIDSSDQQPLPVVRLLQRRLAIQQDTSANELMEREKEAKLLILSVLNNLIEEALKEIEGGKRLKFC